MKKYLNLIDYLSKVYWDNIAHNILNMALSLMFGFSVFAIAMASVEGREERIELVRKRKGRGEEELEQLRTERKQDMNYLESQLAY